MEDTSDFLFGGTGKAAKFEELGDAVNGVITDAVVQQQTSMDTNEPLTWSNGDPRRQLVVTLQTELNEGDDDDGMRRIYAKDGRFEAVQGSGQSMKRAIADAVQRAGKRTLEEGGKLTVAYTGVGKKTNRGYNAPKLYKAKYEPPKATISETDLFGDEAEPF